MKKNLVGNPTLLILDFMAKRNMVAFENGVTSAQRTKATFLNILWFWANLYSVDNTNSFLDFLTWLDYR